MHTIVAYTMRKGSPLTWTITGAGNTSPSLSPGSGHMIRILYGRVYLDTDASVATRRITFSIQTTAGAVICHLFKSQNDITANQLGEFCFAPVNFLPHTADNYAALSSSASVNLGSYFVLNEPLDIFDTDKFVITITAGVVGDAITGYIKYMQVKR